MSLHGALWLTRKSEKRGSWRQDQGVSWDKLSLHIAVLVASLVGTLKSMGDAHLRGKKDMGMLLGRERVSVPFFPTAFAHFMLLCHI